MALTILVQSDIEYALNQRVEAQRERFRLSKADMVRVGLEQLCDRLEALESPFQKAVDDRASTA